MVLLPDRVTTPRILRGNIDLSIILPEFNYNVFDEDIFIAGMKSTGKSQLAKEIICMIPPGVTILIWDFSRVFTNSGYVVRKIEDILSLLGNTIVLQLPDMSKQQFLRFCKFVFTNLLNVVVVFDEIHQYLSKQGMEDEHSELVLSGRNKGICSISISTGTNTIPNYIMQNCTHAFAKKHTLTQHVKWLAENIGPDCWQLLPQDKRRQVKSAEPYWDKPDLGKYSYVYRNMNESMCKVVEVAG